MFEAAELGRTIEKDDYKKQAPDPPHGAARDAATADQCAVPGDCRVCRRRRSGQGGDRQPAERMDGSALDRDARLRGAVR